MQLHIKKNEELILQKPKFLCDDDINPNLNNYDMLSNFNKFCFSGVIGKPGSGKTSLIMSWINSKHIFKKMFDHVIIIMPQSSINSMKNNPFKNHPADKIFEELNMSSIDIIYNKLLKNSANDETTLLIMDDVGASMKNKLIKNTMRKIIYNRRHLKCQIICLLQSFLSLEKEIRKLFNNVIMFKPSKVEFQNLFDELFENDKEIAMDVMKLTFDEPHNYLMLNVDNQRMFKMYDEIIINEKNNIN
jgi:hypothetical protein